MAPTRKSYSREFKLETVKWFYDNEKNMNRTSNKIEVDRKQVRNWINHEDTITQQKPKSFSKRHGKVMYPMLEKELHTKFTEMRTIGKRVKRWWFNNKAKHIMQELCPDNVDEFKMSNKWFI